MKKSLLQAALGGLLTVGAACADPVYNLTEWLTSGAQVITGPWGAGDFPNQLPYIQFGLDQGVIDSFRWCEVGGCTTPTPPSTGGYELYLFADGLVLRGPYEYAAYVKAQLVGEVSGDFLQNKLQGVEFSHGEHNPLVPHTTPSDTPEPVTSALIGVGILAIVGIEKLRSKCDHNL